MRGSISGGTPRSCGKATQAEAGGVAPVPFDFDASIRTRDDSGRSVSPMLGKVRHVPPLDGLRALCVTAVIFTHAAIPSTSEKLTPWIGYVAERGWLGVDVFFVLSGFLITWILSVELESSGTIRLGRFYLRRALRIQPAYFSGLIFTLLLVLFKFRHYFPETAATLPFFMTYTLNLAIAWGLTPAQVRYGQAWSLCIEEQFYFLWPVTLRMLGDKAWRFLLVAIAAVMTWRTLVFWWFNRGHFFSAGADVRYVYFSTDTRIDTILIGCFTALTLRNPAFAFFWNRIARTRGLTLAMAALTVGLVAWCTHLDSDNGLHGSWRMWTFGSTFIAASVGLLIGSLVLQPDSYVARLLSLRPLVFVGRISYGMYLFHFFAFGCVYHLTHQRPGVAQPASITLLTFTMVLGTTIVIAWLHYIAVEKRCLALRERGEAAPRPAIPDSKPELAAIRQA
jgi:peptidoglycan/LPS O-acetylase OafA/YrhL